MPGPDKRPQLGNPLRYRQCDPDRISDKDPQHPLLPFKDILYQARATDGRVLSSYLAAVLRGCGWRAARHCVLCPKTITGFIPHACTGTADEEFFVGSQASFDRGCQWVPNIRVFVFVLFHFSIQLIGLHDLFCFSMNGISAHPYYRQQCLILVLEPEPSHCKVRS